MSTTPSSRSSPVDIQALLAEFDASGKTAASFARERGIASWKLYDAIRARLGKAARRGRVDLVPVRVVEAPAPPSALELVLGGELCLRISPGFDEVTLRRVLGVLGKC